MASITITTPGPEDATIAANIGRYMNLGRSVTVAEIKAYLIAHLKMMNKTGAEMLSADAHKTAFSEINPS